MKKVYLGQTDRGSFILNAGSPVQRPVDRLVDEEPFERLVTETLLRSINAARVAAEKVTLQTSED